MGSLSIPAAGMDRALAQFEKAAGRIGQTGFTAVQNSGGDVVDLSVEMVSLMESRNAFTANARVAQSFDQLQQSLLDILA